MSKIESFNNFDAAEAALHDYSEDRSASWLRVLGKEVHARHLITCDEMVWSIVFVTNANGFAEYPVMYRGKLFGWNTDHRRNYAATFFIRPTSNIIKTGSKNNYNCYRQHHSNDSIRLEDTVQGVVAGHIREIPVVPCRADAKIIDALKQQVLSLGGVIVDSTLRGKARLDVLNSKQTTSVESAALVAGEITKTRAAQQLASVAGIFLLPQHWASLLAPKYVLGIGAIKDNLAGYKHHAAMTGSSTVRVLLGLGAAAGHLKAYVDIAPDAGKGMLVHYIEEEKIKQMKLGKFIKAFVTQDNEEIKRRVTQHKEQYLPPDVLFAVSEEDICEVYESGPSSCMTYEMCEYNSDIRPVAAYGDSDLQVAYFMREGRITARTICSMVDKKYIRVYGDYLLDDLLKGMGYSKMGSLSGYMIRAIDQDDDSYVAPYFDGDCLRAKLIANPTGYSEPMFLIDPDGRYMFEQTAGVTVHQYDAYCYHCEHGLNHDDAVEVWRSEVTRRLLCHSCDSSRAVDATDTHGNTVRMFESRVVHARDDAAFTSYDAGIHAGYVRIDNELVGKDDVVRCEFTGEWIVKSDAVELITSAGETVLCDAAALRNNTALLFVKPLKFDNIYLAYTDDQPLEDIVRELGFDVLPLRDALANIAAVCTTLIDIDELRATIPDSRIQDSMWSELCKAQHIVGNGPSNKAAELARLFYREFNNTMLDSAIFGPPQQSECAAATTKPQREHFCGTTLTYQYND